MLRDLLYKVLVQQNPTDVVVERWSSHSVKLGDRSERRFMLGEVDIARFNLVPSDAFLGVFSGLKNFLTFTAFEVKGNKKAGERVDEPTIGEGIEQAVVNLYQGADFSVIVRPDPGDEKRGHLVKICEMYAPKVDLWFYNGKDFVGWKQSPKPTFNAASEQEKRMMLTRLVTSGAYTRINLPDWAKQGKY